MIKPDLEFVYEATGDLEPPVPIGRTYDGTRRIIPIVGGGRVEGPKIKGKLVGNAADWQLIRHDGVTVADAIYALQTDDGVVIQIRNRGLRHGPPEVMARLAALERDGGRRFAAVELVEASRLYVLARRSSEAGQNRRARDELTAFDALMDLAETRAAAMRDGAGS